MQHVNYSNVHSFVANPNHRSPAFGHWTVSWRCGASLFASVSLLAPYWWPFSFRISRFWWASSAASLAPCWVSFGRAISTWKSKVTHWTNSNAAGTISSYFWAYYLAWSAFTIRAMHWLRHLKSVFHSKWILQSASFSLFPRSLKFNINYCCWFHRSLHRITNENVHWTTDVKKTKSNCR